MTGTTGVESGGTPPNITVTDTAVMKRAVGAAAVGNITEWFDFGVYAYLATTIEANFFPPDNPTLAQVGTFAGFAVSFAVRPLGGLFFGPLGDRIGRTRVLSITVIMMAIGTFLLGFIPAYSVIGIWAPILLVLCRVIQGFSTGGEYAGAMTFIAEYSPDKRRGFFGSFLECGTFIGYALGATVATVIPLISSPEFASTWAWRIPFFLALPLGIVGVYLRTRLEETPAFQTLLAESEEREGTQAGAGIKMLFVKYWPAMLTAGGIVVAWNITNYMLTSYMPTFLEKNVTDAGGIAIDTTTSELLQIVILWVAVLRHPTARQLLRQGRAQAADAHRGDRARRPRLPDDLPPDARVGAAGGRRAGRDGDPADPVLVHLAVHAAGAVPDGDPLRRAVHLVQHLRVGLRRDDVADHVRAGPDDGLGVLARRLPDLRRGGRS